MQCGFEELLIIGSVFSYIAYIPAASISKLAVVCDLHVKNWPCVRGTLEANFTEVGGFTIFEVGENVRAE